jgi:hypothetical protein
MGIDQPSGRASPGDGPQPPAEAGADAAQRIQILATEHWSLLASRSLTYSESLGRVAMFLSVLSGAVISLALVAQADRFGHSFFMVAILVLFVVLFVGVATLVRLTTVSQEELRWIIGMNRIRAAYLELHPELERYFVTGSHDDLADIRVTLGLDTLPNQGIRGFLNSYATLPGMLAVIVAVVAGALLAMASLAFRAPQGVALAAAAAGFAISLALFNVWGVRWFGGFARNLQPRFPREGPADRS